MHCLQSSEELASLMDGELAPERAAQVERHAAGCAACRQRLSQLRQTASLMAALPEVAPPPDLWARVQRKAAQRAAAPALACSAVRDMLDEYVHGELTSADADAVAAHVLECAACAQELAQLEQGIGLLRTLGDVAAPAGLRQQAQREAARRARPIHARPTFRGMAATLATAAAAAVVVLALRAPTAVRPPIGPSEGGRAAAPGARSQAAPAPVAPSPAERIAGVTAEEVAAAARRLTEAAAGSEPTAAQRTASERSRPAGSAVAARRTASAPALRAALAPAARAETASAQAAPASAAAADLNRADTGEERLARLPIATPAAQPTALDAGPAVEPEPAVQEEEPPRPHPTREVVQAFTVAAYQSPLSEVQQIVREQPRRKPPTLRPERERDRFASGPIAQWGY